MGEKLATQCLQTHVKKIIQQFGFYQLTKVSILVLSDLCKNNALVRSWIQQNCFSQLEQIRHWCRENKKFKNNASNQRNNRNNNRRYSNNQGSNIKFYRYLPQYEDKNRNEKLNKWKKKVQNKVLLGSNQNLMA